MPGCGGDRDGGRPDECEGQRPRLFGGAHRLIGGAHRLFGGAGRNAHWEAPEAVRAPRDA
jgi:hypothetical protein